MRGFGRRSPNRRIETALDVLCGFEVETLLLYATEEVYHRFVGPGVFRGSGRGKEALRSRMVAVLRQYIGGFETWEEGRHFGEGFAVLEWRCEARTPVGRPEGFEGILLVHFQRDRITAIRGYFCPVKLSGEELSQNGEGEKVDEDGDHDGDYQEEDHGDL